MTEYSKKTAQLILERARGLAIDKCYITIPNWKEEGFTTVIVTRRHKQGTYTLGIYMLDTWCRGLINTTGGFSMSEEDKNEAVDMQDMMGTMQEITYNEAHNLIYAALEWGEECGLKPHEEWWYTQYILEEDDDRVPLIDYEMGLKGEYFLNNIDQKEFDRIYPIITKTLGHDILYNIHRETPKSELGKMVMEELSDDLYESFFGMKKDAKDWMDEEEDDWEDDDDEEDDWEDDDDEEERDPNLIYEDFIDPKTKAGRKPKLKLPQLIELLDDEMDEENIEAILSLPHDELRQDLEAIIRYQFNTDHWDHLEFGTMYAIMLLAEVGNDDSLKLILETLRQDEIYDSMMIDEADGITYSSTLAKLGRNHLDWLLSFMKEPGHTVTARCEVMQAIVNMDYHWPEMNDELLAWWRALLQFYTTALPKGKGCDSETAAEAIESIEQMHNCDKLLHDVIPLFDTGLVDESITEDVDQVIDYLKFGPLLHDDYVHPLNIFERFEELDLI